MSRLSLSGVLAAILLAAGCSSGSNTYKYDAQGAPYEIVVVADHAIWDGAVGDTLRQTFYRHFPKVNRSETSFDILRVLPSGFNKLIKRHRNILTTSIDPTLTEASLNLVRDAYAQPQTVVMAAAPDAVSLAELVNDNRENLMLVFETAEKDRDVAAATSHTPPQIASLIKEKFGIEMSTGPGYTVRSESEDFLWLSYEMPTASQGIVIYTYPFSGVKDFDLENLLARRDEFVKRIPAENPGSHMATNPDPGFIEVVYKTIESRPWAEMLGFWDAVGDFMGGPYRNYSTFDAANQRVVAIDFYVFCPDPNLKQRNYVKQLEHFLYTVKIPGQSLRWDEVGTSSAATVTPTAN